MTVRIICRGAPNTRNTGITMDSIMWATMCMENMAGMYRPIPELMASARVMLPSSHQKVRCHGQAFPNCFRRYSPYR